MTTSTPAALTPVVTFERHSAPSSWTPARRAELAARLAKVGLTITETSDARERLGFPRLSDASDWDRANCHLHAESPEFQAVLADIRREHLELVGEIGRADRKVAAKARNLLGFRAGWNLRIGELEALARQVRILEILAETPRTVQLATASPKLVAYTEAELFRPFE
jgi:hypothetical protein